MEEMVRQTDQLINFTREINRRIAESGVSGVELLKVMYDFRAEPEDVPPPAQPWVPARSSSLVRRFADGVRDQVSVTEPRIRTAIWPRSKRRQPAPPACRNASLSAPFQRQKA